MAAPLSGISQSSLFHFHPNISSSNEASFSTLRLRSHQSLISLRQHASLIRPCSFGRIFPIRALSPDSTESPPSVVTGNADLGTKEVELEIGSGGGDNISGGGDGGGDGNQGGGGGDNEEDGAGESSDDSMKKIGLSMSQKITLGYAALVGVGGLMGYMKSGSQKSLLAGGISAAVLFFVFMRLPADPVFASSVGIVMSATLLGVMGSRFLKSRKVFPAGIVSFVSLIMTGGYVHGVMRGMH